MTDVDRFETLMAAVARGNRRRRQTMSAASSARSDAKTIGRSVAHLVEMVSDLDGRLYRASDEGAKLAAAVMNHLYPNGARILPPELQPLLDAYTNFMQAHSGNFSLVVCPT